MALKMSLSGVVVTGIVLLLFHLYNVLVLKPKRLRAKLQNQGIRGPSPSFLYGNIPEVKRIVQEQAQLSRSLKDAPEEDEDEDHHHDHHQHQAAITHNWPSILFPHFYRWRNAYGPVFVHSTGTVQVLCVADIEMAKQIALGTSLSLGKPSYLSKDYGPLFGLGIVSSGGQIWAHQRKIIAPEFYLDKVKGMVELMVDATSSVLKCWESRIETAGGTLDIRVDEDMRSLSADIIVKVCFGSSYLEGQGIFSTLRTLQKMISMRQVGIPSSRYLPTKLNREIWKLEREIQSLILGVVNQRIKGTYEKDILQMILEGAQSYGDYIFSSNIISHDKFIVDNCKNIYFAGHETTAITASWSLMLLAAYPDWQARARAEVLEICKGDLPDADMLQNMKTLTMVVQEVLRLYPPAVFVVREALEDVKFKDIAIPKGMNIQIPVAILQQDTDLWGADAHKFNPERFANGVLGACKFPQAYMPFGIGSRTCLGQNFAQTEVKVILCLILSKFCFSLSPSYHHSPACGLVLEPGDGVCLTIKRL